MAAAAASAYDRGMALTDDWGLELSTLSEAAAAAYREGAALLLSAWPGAGERFEAALAHDPGFALAHVGRARGLAVAGDGAGMRAALARAAALGGTERERGHVAVMTDALAGRSDAALAGALAHAERWPRDVMILGLPLGAFGLFAFSGMADHDAARVALMERHRGAFADDDWWFLTYYGWALAEHGAAAQGRAMLERAVALRRANANGVHALAHALHEGGAGAEAEALIAGWLPEYERGGILHGHIAWHRALVALERGDVAAALAIHADQVRPAVSRGMAINIVTDGASLLWRMAAYGHDVAPALWRELADYARPRFGVASHGFVDPHMAMIEAVTGDHAALARRLAALEAMAARGTLPAGAVVPAIARAVLAFAEGDARGAIASLEPVADEVVRIGGSGAQREVIEETLLVAYMRAGETAKARAMLDRRLHRRPSIRDAHWRAQVAA